MVMDVHYIKQEVALSVAEKRLRMPEEKLRDMKFAHDLRRGFFRTLWAPTMPHRVIAEFKRSSPSGEVFREDRFFRTQDSAARAAASYECAGATCISVVTQPSRFRGSLQDLEDFRTHTTIPLLRKDFIVDGYQIVEARAYGADAVLLIAALLDDYELSELMEVCFDESIDPLVEVHSEEEFERALNLGASIVGVNNRNLRTQEIDLGVTRRLAPLSSADIILVSESGFSKASEIEEMENLGVDAFLIGSTLMRSENPGKTLSDLVWW